MSCGFLLLSSEQGPPPLCIGLIQHFTVLDLGLLEVKGFFMLHGRLGLSPTFFWTPYDLFFPFLWDENFL